MERTKFQFKEPPDNGDLTLSKSLRDILFKQKNCADAIALYLFYLHTSNWQNNDQPKANNEYCMKGLHWGKDRVKNAQKTLKRLRLIKPIQKRNQFGKYENSYMKISLEASVPQRVHREPVLMLSDDNRSISPRASKPAGGFGAINTKRFRSEVKLPPIKNKLYTCPISKNLKFGVDGRSSSEACDECEIKYPHINQACYEATPHFTKNKK
jgi:hypothetical protein